MDTGALVLSSDFDAILAKRDACVRGAKAFDEAVSGAPEGFPAIFVHDAVMRVDTRWNLDVVVRSIERDAWESLVAGTGLYSFMDAQARKEWAEQLERGKLLPFTKENAEAFVAGLHSQRGAMVKRGVAECFRRLSGHYKTNRPDRFGARMIVTHVLTVYGSGKQAWHSTNHRACDDFDDLQRVLHLLRGLPEPDHRQGSYQLMSRGAELNPSGGAWPRVVVFPFFKVKVHKNGNGHLTFDHEADVLRLNKVLSLESGGLALPDDSRAKRRPVPMTDPAGDLEFFATPPALVRELVQRAGVRHGDKCLEPSGGEGAIAWELVERAGQGNVTVVEIDGERARQCEQAVGAACVYVADFVQWDSAARFDRIVMNPPFSSELDHVTRAWELLAPGGRLVAVMSSGVTFRSGQYAEFRDWLAEAGGTFEDLPEGSFKSSGTNVRAVVVTVDR